MNTEELRKLLKKNGVVAYSYWGKNKLIDLAKINNLLPEPKPEPEEPEEPKQPENISWQRLKNIRKSPVKVKIIDIETGEEKIFPSIYKTAQFLDRSPQTIRHYGQRKGIWNKKISSYNRTRIIIYLC